MAITTYSELRTAVANWLGRAEFVGQIPDFIALCEAKLNRTLRVRQMEQRATASLSTEYIALPTDYVEMRNIQLNTNPKVSMEYVTPEYLDKVRGSTTSGKPVMYTLVGGEIQVAPSPDTAYTIEIDYYKKITALTDAATTNWLLTAYPDVYLYGSLAEAPLSKEQPEMILWDTRYRHAVANLKQGDLERWTGAAPRMRVTGVV